MRIAYLVHFYPPSSCGGAGYYTAVLAEGLREAGAEVGVVCVDRWGEGERYFNGYTDDVYNGIPVRRLHVNWQKAPRPFDWLYDSPVLGEQVRAYLEGFCPDVVHVSSCYTLSARPVFVTKEMGFPVVMHLHDYWGICARLTLLHKDGTICDGPESAWGCQRCLLYGTKVWRLARVLPESIRKSFFERLAEIPWATRQRGLQGMLGDLDLRSRFVLASISAADVLITPTAFARNQLESHGIPAGRIQVLPYGNQVEWAQRVNWQPAKHLRIGFLGNVLPHKGVHLLVEAHERLLEFDREVELQIWGDTTLAPEYYQALRESYPQKILWGGRYSRDDLARILSGLDVVVVPSIWYETQGIVIQEAFAAGLPVIVSAGTSLADSVIDGVNGICFQLGSSEGLARQMKRLLAEPGLLSKLRSNVPPVRMIADDVAEYSALYAKLMCGREPHFTRG